MPSGISTACWLENCPLTNETQSLSLGDLYQLSPNSDILLLVKKKKVVYLIWLGELLTRSRTELFALVEVQNNYMRTHACVFVWIPMYGSFPCTRDRIQWWHFSLQCRLMASSSTHHNIHVLLHFCCTLSSQLIYFAMLFQGLDQKQTLKWKFTNCRSYIELRWTAHRDTCPSYEAYIAVLMVSLYTGSWNTLGYSTPSTYSHVNPFVINVT